MKPKIVAPYAPVLVESIRSVGYSFESALADIIDNSIGKGASEIQVNFQSISNPYIAVCDDACGMSDCELELAMRYGSKSSLEVRDENDLGRFGLGMKMASLSQCRKLTVVTKKDGKLSAACWDLDYIIKAEDWALQKYSRSDLPGIPHIEWLHNKKCGTIVVWEQFDRLVDGSSNIQKVFEEKIDIARDHIALVFHRFTSAENNTKKLQILFNGERVEPMDPFLTYHTATQRLTERTIRISNQKIKVKPFILPYYSKLNAKDKRMLGDINDLRHKQGFYIYRNKRLIIWGTWFRLIKSSELNKLARIRVDIPNTLDSIWEIDIKKSTASLPDIIKKELLAAVDDTIIRSERVYRYRGRKTMDDTIINTWNIVNNRGRYQYLINRELPLLKMLESLLPEDGHQYIESFLRIIEESFPYGDVYYRMAKSEGSIQTASMSYEEAYKVATDTIASIKALNGNTSAFIKSMGVVDYFKQYPDVIIRIKEEYAGD